MDWVVRSEIFTWRFVGENSFLVMELGKFIDDHKIYVMRGKKVMVDRDLAELYGVETRVLNQAVRRNENWFPEDFLSQMTSEEVQDWKSQIVISNTEKMGLRKLPLVFTEQGIAMLSGLLSLFEIFWMIRHPLFVTPESYSYLKIK